jgi:hypothetical protein
MYTFISKLLKMPKPLNRGGAESQIQPKLVHHTRSVTHTTAISKPISQQSTLRASAIKDQQKGDPSLMEANDMATTVKAIVLTITIVTMKPILEGLNKILNREESPKCIIKGIVKYIRKLEAMEKEDEDRCKI